MSDVASKAGDEAVRFDLSLYLVAGSGAVAGRDLIEVVMAAVRGGTTLVQLREKDRPTAEVVDLARALKDRLAGTGVPLIINDDVEVALAAGADGVHLGQDDADPHGARARLGPDRILGFSAGDLEEAKRVDAAIMDYVGVGPAYRTGSKADAGPAIGLEGLRTMRAALDLPLVAIGGIDGTRAKEVMTTGVDGIAVVSAVCGAPDPEAAARDLRQKVAKG